MRSRQEHTRARRLAQNGGYELKRNQPSAPSAPPRAGTAPRKEVMSTVEPMQLPNTVGGDCEASVSDSWQSARTGVTHPATNTSVKSGAAHAEPLTALPIIKTQAAYIQMWKARALKAEAAHATQQADDERLRQAAERAGVLYVGCDTPDALAEAVLTARQALATQQAALVEYIDLRLSAGLPYGSPTSAWADDLRFIRARLLGEPGDK